MILVGGICSNGCPNCTSDFYACKNVAQNATALCACHTDLVNCYASSKDASCDSAKAYSSCLDSVSGCACGTPYTGTLTYKDCNENAYCSDDGTCTPLGDLGSDCNNRT